MDKRFFIACSLLLFTLFVPILKLPFRNISSLDANSPSARLVFIDYGFSAIGWLFAIIALVLIYQLYTEKPSEALYAYTAFLYFYFFSLADIFGNIFELLPFLNNGWAWCLGLAFTAPFALFPYLHNHFRNNSSADIVSASIIATGASSTTILVLLAIITKPANTLLQSTNFSLFQAFFEPAILILLGIVYITILFSVLSKKLDQSFSEIKTFFFHTALLIVLVCSVCTVLSLIVNYFSYM